MNEIIEIKLIESFKIWMKFLDGTSKIVDFQPFVGSGISAQLADEDYFKSVYIEPGGGLAWPNGFDFCPNFLKDFVEDKSKLISL